MKEFIHSCCLRPEWAGRTALYLHGTNISVSYASLAAAVATMAGLLERSGVGRGARIAVAAAPSFEFAVAVLAASRIGAAAAPLDISLRGLSLDDALARVRPDVLIGTPALVARMGKWNARVAIICERLDHDGAPTIAGSVQRTASAVAFEIMAAPAADGGDASAVTEGSLPDDDALLIATSGSTGAPKYVRLGHRGTLFNIREHLASFGLAGPFSAVQALGTNYSYGLIASFLAPLTVGGTLVLPAHTDCRSICAAIAAEHPSVCLATPALIEYLIDACTLEQLAALGSLGKLGIGGDNCPERLRRKISQALPRVAPYVTYGATEAGPRIATLPPAEFLTRSASVGLPLAGVEIMVTDDHGRPVAPGATGYVRVRTPSRMVGYLGEAPQGDWLTISDMASLDVNGYLTIHGRAGRAVKHRGRLLDPGQIESVIGRFPGVIGSRVEVLPAGGRLRAVVHLHPSGHNNDLASRLREHCLRNLPHRLVPHEIVTVAEKSTYFFKGRSLLFSDSQPQPAE